MKDKSAFLFLLLGLGATALVILAFLYFFIWLFSLGEFPILDAVSYFVGTYTATMFLINLLFGFRAD